MRLLFLFVAIALIVCHCVGGCNSNCVRACGGPWVIVGVGAPVGVLVGASVGVPVACGTHGCARGCACGCACRGVCVCACWCTCGCARACTFLDPLCKLTLLKNIFPRFFALPLPSRELR